LTPYGTSGGITGFLGLVKSSGGMIQSKTLPGFSGGITGFLGLVKSSGGMIQSKTLPGFSGGITGSRGLVKSSGGRIIADIGFPSFQGKIACDGWKITLVVEKSKILLFALPLLSTELSLVNIVSRYL
jgi:hypothetical protein